MGTLNERRLSESVNGRPIAIGVIVSPGTLLHTATTDTGEDGYDKIQLYVANIDDVDHTLSMQWGGVAASDLLPVIIPATLGLYLTIPVLLLEGGAELRAFADVIDVLNVAGYVLRAAALGEPGFQSRVGG